MEGLDLDRSITMHGFDRLDPGIRCVGMLCLLATRFAILCDIASGILRLCQNAMYSIRRFIVAVLVLTLPLSALAYAGVEKHCVMTANGMVMDMMDMDGDCCDKHSGSPEKSKGCNPTQDCNTFQCYPPATTWLPAPMPAPPTLVLTPPSDHNPRPLRDALRRPPRLTS